MTRRDSRSGFALVTVLWLLVLLSSAALVAVRAGRLAVDSASRRVVVERATWLGRGCLAGARAALSEALRSSAGVEGITLAWRKADVVLRDASIAVDSRCALEAEPLGTRLDLNAADSLSILRFLRAAAPTADALGLTAALLDWRDPDGATRPSGAERDWYTARGRVPPRDGPFRAREELQLVRGFETAARILQLTDVEPARISLDHAPPELLMAIEGLDAATVDYMLWRLHAGVPPRDLDALILDAPQALHPRLLAAFATLASKGTMDPDGWLLRAVVKDSQGRVLIRVEDLVRRLGAAVTTVRERAW